MSKIVDSAGMKAKTTFEEMPSMLSAHRKNFRPRMIKKNSRQTYFASDVEWLVSARICERCKATTAPYITSNLNNDEPFRCLI